MAIERIDPELCNGCGICVDSCPTDVLRIDPELRRAVIAYPHDCTLCGWCKVDCPRSAIVISEEKGSWVITSWG